MPNPNPPGTYSPFNYQGSRSAWVPLVDGQVIVDPPTAVRVPAIFGSNTEDGSLFVLSAYGQSSSALNQSTYDEFLTYNFGPLAHTVNETFSLDKFNGSVAAAVTTIVTDNSYKCQAYRGLVAAKKAGVPVWSYEWDHTPSCAWYSVIPQASLPYLGATHTAEIPFVFNTTHNLPLSSGNCSFTIAEQALAKRMSRTWTNMAELGNVGDEALWPQWTTESSAGVVIKDFMTAGTLDYSNCAFWEAINAAAALIVYGS
jgi:carboxylesterase type B